MARLIKNNAEYFSHDADMRNDIKVKALRRRFSHKGYAVWCFLLETLTDTDFFEICFDEVNKELLAADYDISIKDLEDIVDYCVKINLLQITKDNNLYSDAHKRRFQDLLNRRAKLAEAGKKGMGKRWSANNSVTKKDNQVITSDNQVITSDNQVITSDNQVITSDNQVITSDNQVITSDNIVKYSKGEYSKGKESVYPYQDIVEMWNKTCKSLPKILKLSENRKQKIKSRLHEFGEKYSWMSTIEALFKEIESSDFLKGENKNGWKATFDWLFENSNNWVKVIEGNYRSNENRDRKSPYSKEFGESIARGIKKGIDARNGE